MSSYRTYTTWNKNTPSSNYTNKTDSTLSKYENQLSRQPKPEAKDDPPAEKPQPPASKLSGAPSSYRPYGTVNQRDRSVGREANAKLSVATPKEPEKPAAAATTTSVRDKYTTGTTPGSYVGRRDSLTRPFNKPLEIHKPEKKETAPPVSFRGLGRPATATGSRSRDPSPAPDREKTDNYRLYSRTNLARSTSREPDNKYKSASSKEDINTIANRYGSVRKIEPKEDATPKYGGRASINRQETKEENTPRYGGRTSLSKQESKEDVTPKYGGRSSISRQESKEDITPKYGGRTSFSRQESKEDITPKYGGRASFSRQESKEDTTPKFATRTTYSRQESKEETPKFGTRTYSRQNSKEDVTPKYGGRSSVSQEPKEEPATKYTRPSRIDTKETSTKFTRPTATKQDLINSLTKYNTSRNSSKEDLSPSTPKSYINSRFLPKNTIEASYTYSKPINKSLSMLEERRKRENLLLTQALNRQRTSSSTITSPPPSLHREKSPPLTPAPKEPSPPKEEEIIEMETVSVVTRGTSPAPSSQSAYHRTRRLELAREVQKDITRPKKRAPMVDKEIQSDRMDDTARYSRFSSSSTMSATSSTPWSSFLDLKFNSPRPTNYNSNSTKISSEVPRLSKENSPASRTEDVVSDIKEDTDISRTDSISIDISLDSSSKKSSNVKSSSENLSAAKSKSQKSLSRSDSKKDLTKKSSSSPSLSDKLKSSTSLSTTPSHEKSKSPTPLSTYPSTKSRSPTPLSTDSSTKSKSPPKKQGSPESTSSKKLPPLPKGESPAKSVNSCHSITQNKDFRKSVLNMGDNRCRKSPKRSSSVSSDSDPSRSNSISEDATTISTKLSTSQSLSKVKTSTSSSKLPQKVTSRTDISDRARRSKTRSPSICSLATDSDSSSSSDEDTQKSSKSDSRRRILSAGSSRTSMILSADELSLDSTSKPSPKPPPSPRLQGSKPEAEAAKSFLMRALAPVTNFFKTQKQDSSDKINWMDSSSDNTDSKKSDKDEKKLAMLRRIESGERPWWIDENAEPPEGIQKLPPDGSCSSSSKSSNKEDKRKNFIKRIESGERAWWLEENADLPEGVKKLTITCSADGDIEHGKKLYKFIKQESGEAPWWMQENGEIPEEVEKMSNGNSSPKTRKKSPDSVHWQDQSDKSNSSQDKSNASEKQSDFVNPYKIRHIDSGEKPWWTNSSENIPEEAAKEEQDEEKIKQFNRLFHQQSGEKAWWLMSNPNIPEGIQVLSSSDTESDSDKEEPLGDRASPEGLETPQIESGRLSPYDNVPEMPKPKRPTHIPLFISRHTNIDDILGGSNQLLSPLMDRIMNYQDKTEEVEAEEVIVPDSSAEEPDTQPTRIDVVEGSSDDTPTEAKLDDAALQLYKDGDYSSYLDLEASISEQQEEFEGFQTNKKNSIVLRTQLSVRVHTIIEKLLTSEGRELRRALFSLKQIFQEDKDLVHEFVQNDGLACLIKVGSEADQNYQNYILRALGQVMLYVDGMNGVMEHNQTVQWLYTLIASKFRLVVKTALKLLLVFVEYTDSNCMLLIKAVNAVDGSQGLLSWTNIMRLLKDFNSADTELLIYAMTLVNKCLNGIPDQDTYYDQTDALEEQGIEGIIQRYMSKQGTDLDLLQQFQIYEAVLQHEDGEDKGTPLRHLDESIRKTLRNRKSMVDSAERRRSRRHSTGTTPGSGLNTNNNNKQFYSLQTTVDDEDESSSSQSSGPNDHNLNGSYKENHKSTDAGVTPALRRRRERAERQRSFIREQQESAAILRATLDNQQEDTENGNYNNNNMQQKISNGNMQLNRNSSRKDLTPLLNAVNKLDSTEEGILKKPWVLSMMYGKNPDGSEEIIDENADNTNEDDRKLLILKRENTVKDLTQKLTNQNILHSPSEENKVNRIGDMSGLISKAKEGLAKSKSKPDVLKSPTSEIVPKIEPKKSENELRWEELVQCMNRPLNLCDLDFTDLQSEDEVDILAPAATSNGIPPPPPPLCNDMAPPPPPLANRNPPPFPTAPMFPTRQHKLTPEPPKANTIKKNKKTVKLFWKEVRDDPIAITKLQKTGGMIWDELDTVSIDTQKLEHLFESRAKDLISKEKQQEMNKNKEIIVLDHKRSNAINIGMTKLPPPRSIKTAILKMDATIMNREGIEKLLTMLPTEEERTKIQDAQAANPDLPLGSAEQFLITLASISELPARLKLWAFKLDFENTEREIAEPLMDLKQGFEVLKRNPTFRGILGTLRSIGIFLNGAEVKGFQIEYLAKVPEVKDTVHKHSLLHHLCHIVMEKFPEATDLYSEIGAITRASKIDFDELALNIGRLESDCKASWDHLKLIAKHDGSTMMKVKMSDFLADCAERIILLGIVHRRVMNRYHKFLLWLGIPLHRIADSKPNEFCRIVSEFSLEYRTTRERVLQQLEKKANHRERNKTRGKMITEVGKFKTKEDRADAELRQLLGSDISDVESMQGTLPWRRTRKDMNSILGVPNGNITDDGDDEILESLVKTATKAPSARTTPRERKRTRHADRKSLRRTLKNGLSEEEKKHIAAYIKGY